MPCKYFVMTAGRKTTSSNKQKHAFHRFFLKLLNLFALRTTEHIRDEIMNNNEKHIDENYNLRVSSKLQADLKTLFEPDVSVPGEVDRAVMDRVNQRLIRWQKRGKVFRWAASVAGVAAVIIAVFMFEAAKEPDRTVSRSSVSIAQADIDRSGSVDILDAFKLARHVESAGRPNMKWDINRDGLVNRQDVDSVAFAAVRLDKGVL